jgi:hypothetical protein
MSPESAARTRLNSSELHFPQAVVDFLSLRNPWASRGSDYSLGPKVTMKTTALGLVAISLVQVLTPTPSWAKGETVKITLTCTGLAGPVDLTDPTALTLRFGPWGGAFLDSTRTGRPGAGKGQRQCEVALYVRYNVRDVQLAYVFYYYPGGASNPGYIYLPGPRDPWYTLNVGTMWRQGQDGKWHVASQEWDALARHAIAEAQRRQGATS